ncbi:LPXTG cell wall anchor domain-containing protein [Spirillospora sp. NPDC050679]
MDTNLRRTGALAAATALALALLAALTGGPARAAGVDIDAVAESITESGYYVDSRARYLKSDKAQDALRDSQERSVPVFVAVVPAGNDAAAILRQLPAKLERKGTYAVLAGEQLRVASDTLPAAQVKNAYAKAVKANKARPDIALVTFIRTLPTSPQKPPAKARQATLAEVEKEKPAPASGSKAEKQTEKQAAKEAEKSSSNTLMLAGGAAVLLLVAGAGAFVLLKRRKKPAAPGPEKAVAGRAAGPGDDAPRPPAQPPHNG